MTALCDIGLSRKGAEGAKYYIVKGQLTVTHITACLVKLSSSSTSLLFKVLLGFELSVKKSSKQEAVP